MATYAIGDVQGCRSSLDRLLDTIHFSPSRDRIRVLGDLVNRGPDSAGVLRRLRTLGPAASAVLGNHDLRFLAYAEGCVPARRKDTFLDIARAPDRNDLIHWLSGQPLIHQEGPFLMVHAGLLPQWTVPEAIGLAREVEDALRGQARRALLRRLHRDECPQWKQARGGLERLQVIASVLTRIRACTAEGDVAWPFTGPLASVPEGFHPWFEAPGRKSQEAIIVCGHWAALGLHRRSTVVALDSGCVWGRKLTAFRLDDGAIFQVSCAKARAQEAGA